MAPTFGESLRSLTLAAAPGPTEIGVRGKLTRKGLRELMKELARSAPGRRAYRVYLVGGGTAVLLGWRDSTIDADLYSDREEVFRDIQKIKERFRRLVHQIAESAYSRYPALSRQAVLDAVHDYLT